MIGSGPPPGATVYKLSSTQQPEAASCACMCFFPTGRLALHPRPINTGCCGSSQVCGLLHPVHSDCSQQGGCTASGAQPWGLCGASTVWQCLLLCQSMRHQFCVLVTWCWWYVGSLVGGIWSRPQVVWVGCRI